MLALLHVFERTGPGPDDLHWKGYTLADPEALADLTPKDRAAWGAWVAEPKAAEFLEDVIVQCKVQAEANRSNPGFMVFGGMPPSKSSEE